MPDRDNLAARMESKNAAKLVADLRDRNDNLDLLGEVIYCFRELSLAAFVLQHVYPKRFAMCSHHLASQLWITATTVPEFYFKYCNELKEWSKHEWPTPRRLTVVEAEFALWTWYRCAYGKSSKQRGIHQTAFRQDHWIQERRPKQIADSLGLIDRLDLARSFLDTDPTAAAIIAWREFETKVREVTGCYEKVSMFSLIDRLQHDEVPQHRTKDFLKDLWSWRGPGRNPIMHQGAKISDKKEAKRVLNGVVEFIERQPRSGTAKAVRDPWASIPN
jgi:hypothetical protein